MRGIVGVLFGLALGWLVGGAMVLYGQRHAPPPRPYELEERVLTCPLGDGYTLRFSIQIPKSLRMEVDCSKLRPATPRSQVRAHAARPSVSALWVGPADPLPSVPGGA